MLTSTNWCRTGGFKYYLIMCRVCLRCGTCLFKYTFMGEGGIKSYIRHNYKFPSLCIITQWENVSYLRGFVRHLGLHLRACFVRHLCFCCCSAMMYSSYRYWSSIDCWWQWRRCRRRWGGTRTRTDDEGWLMVFFSHLHTSRNTLVGRLYDVVVKRLLW